MSSLVLLILSHSKIAPVRPVASLRSACRAIYLCVIFPSSIARGRETMSAGGREAAGAASSEGVEITRQVADGVWARATELRRDPARWLFASDGTLSRGLVFA